MLEGHLRAGAVCAVLFLASTYCGFQSLYELCERAGVPALSYQLEYPVLSNWTRVATGGYFDELLHLRYTLARAAGTIGISSFWASTAERLGVPFAVVPGYLPDEISALAGRGEHSRPESGCFHLVTLGNWVPRECPLIVLRAVREAYNDGIPIRYTAIGRVGGSPMERAAMRMYEGDSVLRKIVRIAGWVDEAEKEKLLESADAFVLLRRPNIETAALFPTRLPEYLAHARPVIASSAGDLSRYLQHKKSAWLVPGGDDGTSLRAAIGELYRDRELAHTIGRGGLARAIESFSIEGNGKRMSEFINSVIAGRSHGQQVTATTYSAV
jgi:glycosyltransferase involved in cell wall biosynthesis